MIKFMITCKREVKKMFSDNKTIVPKIYKVKKYQIIKNSVNLISFFVIINIKQRFTCMWGGREDTFNLVYCNSKMYYFLNNTEN